MADYAPVRICGARLPVGGALGRRPGGSRACAYVLAARIQKRRAPRLVPASLLRSNPVASAVIDTVAAGA